MSSDETARCRKDKVMSHHALELVRSKGNLPARYGNFIGGKWVAPAEGRYFTDYSPINGAGWWTSPSRQNAMSNWRSTQPTRQKTPGRAYRRPNGQSCSTRSRTGWRIISNSWRLPKPWTTASRSARRAAPIYRSQSTIFATSPAVSGPRKAEFPPSTPRPSRIILRNRWGSSARSSPGTSRC